MRRAYVSAVGSPDACKRHRQECRMIRTGTKVEPPYIIAWEVTRNCPLACKHCRASARSEQYTGELSTDECGRLLDNIASFARPTIILTGGEPMLRKDIYEIASHANALGLRVVMATCGVLISQESAASIVESGIRLISISLDGATARSHDSFRGVEGVFERTLKGIEAAKKARLGFQINTTVSKYNVAELPALLELAIELGAVVFNPFLLVPTGRGQQLIDLELSPEEYEETLEWLAEQQGRDDIQIRVTCAPHYQRVLRQRREQKLLDKSRAKGCLGGKSFAFISHRGTVQICGFLDVDCGNVREENFDFRKIWETSKVFSAVREVDAYHGRCGYCEFRKVCGGCRARAYAVSGDYLSEEPYCAYTPKRTKK
jgi:heme b synthase